MIYHVLIVDDETSIKKGLSMLIRKALPNCIVDGTASDGIEAMEMIKNSPPDIVITDIKMPVCNGLELSRFLFENYPDIKIIMLTGFADFEYAQTAIKYRVSDFLLKPTSKDKLVEAITKIQAEIIDLRRKQNFLINNTALFLERALQELASGTFQDEYVNTITSSWPFDNSYYYCISFQCKKQEALGKDHITSIRSILEQQLQSNFIFRYNDAINCLFFTKEAGQPDEVVSFTLEISNLCKLLYGVTVSAGISDAKSTLDDLSTASMEAYSALLSNFFSGKAVGLSNPSNLPSVRQTGLIYRSELFEIEKALDNQNYSSVKEIVQSIFTSFQTNHVSSSQVKYLSGQIYYVLTRVQLHNSLTEAQTDYLALLEHSTNADDLQRSLLQVVTQIEQSVNRRQKHMNQMIHNTATYISQHLTDDLSLEAIADAVNANPSYLSRVFKRECNETITEYITHMRIEKAKELLLSDKLIYMVAESTGFHDPAYFSTTFKKYTGMSPKEFKQKHT